ncbi:MAG: FHA domain-containing protein [Planctomycetes bacterium]|nr:FHA domain-containing protein [Planctomycetota bacterium]
MPILRVKTGPNTGLKTDLSADSLTIGRDVPDGLTIGDKGASRNHAEIFRIGEMFFIKDLVSSNGTYVNDELITEEILQIGDVIRIGQSQICIEESPAEIAKKRSEQDDVNYEFDDKNHEEDFVQTITLDIGSLPSAPQQADQREMRNLSTIYSMNKIISAEKSVRKMLSKILAELGKTIDAESGYIFVKDKKENKLVPHSSWLSTDKDLKKSVIISTSIVKRVLEMGKPIMTTDASSDARFSTNKSVVIKKIRSVVAAPLTSRNEIHGTMYFSKNDSRETFSTEDLELVAAVAIMTATAFDSITAVIKQQETMFSTIHSLVALLEEKDPKMKGHSKRTMNYCAAIGIEMRLTRQQRYWLELAAVLHDLGKLGSDVDSSSKIKKMETAIKTCENLVKNMKDIDEVLPIIRSQYSRFDGTGYPENVKTEDVPLLGKILVVAKDLDVMTTIGGIKKEGMDLKEALVDMGRNCEKRYDKDVVKSLIKSYKNNRLFNPKPVVKKGVI